MRTPIRRSVRFTLHFEATPIPLPLNCLSEYAEPIEHVELLCDGKLLHRYSRSGGSVTREYLCDSSAHTFTLRTCSTVRLESSVTVPAGSDSCLLEASEADRFRLYADLHPAPPSLEIMEYNTTYAVAEDLAEVLLEWENALHSGSSLVVSIGEESFGVYPETANSIRCNDGYTAEYAALDMDRPNCKNYSRLSVTNRRHLQRYVFGYLRDNPELDGLRFEWKDTYLRVTAAEKPRPDLHKLCREISDGAIARLLDDRQVLSLALYTEPTGFTVHCYRGFPTDSPPLAGRSLRYVLPHEDMDAFGSPQGFLQALAQTLEREPSPKIQAENCGDRILLTRRNDPYFTFD